MRKLYLILLALTLSVAMLVISVVPVMAGKPTTLPDNKPVAWVDSAINTNQSAMVGEDPVKTSHSLHVKLLADGTTAGVVEYHNYLTGEKAHYTDFDQNLTRFYEWPDGAKVAEIVVHVPAGEGMPSYHMKYQIVDYGEPATQDWHKVYVWMPDFGYPVPMWWSVFGDFPILYKGDLDKPLFSGNAKVTITDAYVTSFTGNWLLNVNDGAFMHDMVISTQSTTGAITGTGGYPAVDEPPYPFPYNWTMTGQIIGNGITMTITYENGYTATIAGTIAVDGNTMSGGAGTGGVTAWNATRVP
jgi:hypothetical protein